MNIEHIQKLPLDRKLEIIGWPIRQAERRSSFSRDTIRRWIIGKYQANDNFLVWINNLAYGHLRLYSPFSKYVREIGNRPAFTGRDIVNAMLTIGWSEREMVKRLGVQRTSFRRALEKKLSLSMQQSRWLDDLCDLHAAYPRPLSRPRAEEIF